MPFVSSRLQGGYGIIPQSTTLVRTGTIGILLACVSTPAFPQALPHVIDPTGRAGEPPFIEKEKPLKPELPPETILPPVQPPSLEPPPGKGPVLRVFVKQIDVVGSTVFSWIELKRVTMRYENREVSTEDLEELRRALTLLYVNRGYANSGAVIPDQAVTDGTVTVQIIEGVLKDIRIEGNRWFSSSYLKDRLALGAGPPFNMNPLRDRMQIILQDQRLERLNAELKPGDKPGEALLDVHVQEASPIKGWLEFNNYQSPIVGAERGLATLAHQNLTGHGDAASVTYGRSRGVDPLIESSYTLPLNAYDTSFSFAYRRNDFVVVENPFEVLDITSKSEIFTLGLRQPLLRTLTDEVAVSITGERLFNKTTLLGEPFDFVGGYQNGVAVVSAVRFGQEWTHRTADSVIAVRSRFSVGINALGATINSGPVADSQFFSWLGQANAVKRFDSTGIELISFVNLQLANDRLFPLEQFAVGGRYSVRGYREYTLIRDNAFVYSIETRLPLLKSKEGYDILQLAPFIDVGRAWAAKGETPSPETLASIGIGLRWNIFNRANANIYWGQQLNHVPAPPPGGNLQDHGIHIQFVWNVF
jgi:hemolysin activation/secretion protein